MIKQKNRTKTTCAFVSLLLAFNFIGLSQERTAYDECRIKEMRKYDSIWNSRQPIHLQNDSFKTKIYDPRLKRCGYIDTVGEKKKFYNQNTNFSKTILVNP